MNEKEIILTRDGLTKLEEELDELKTVHRREVNERIRQAKEFGDISENAEYEDAKQEQAFVEGRILKLEAMIRNARIIQETEGLGDEVHLGSTVKIKNMTSGLDLDYTIVGSTESDPLNAKISNESPIGQALIGAKPGQTVSATTPSGEIQLKIISIRGNRKTGAKAKAT